MAVFDEHREELEHYETMMGTQRGRLAVSLDIITSALVLAGQHAVYCRATPGGHAPSKDIELVAAELQKAKQLIQSVMEDLRQKKP